MNKLKVSEKFAKDKQNRNVDIFIYGIFIYSMEKKTATYSPDSHQMAIKLIRYYFKIIFHVVDYQDFDVRAMQVVEAPCFLSALGDRSPLIYSLRLPGLRAAKGGVRVPLNSQP